LAVDFDHNYNVEKKIFSTWCPVQDLVLRSLRRLATTRERGCDDDDDDDEEEDSPPLD
jgi:hypothetical protein